MAQDRVAVDLHRWLSETLKAYDMEAFPKELIQNSSDAGSHSITFVIDHRSNTLWHLQSGALSDANFAALGNFYAASKASSHTTIGKFGVGFCVVFHVCDEPHVYSSGRHWTCDLGSLAARRDAASPDHIPANSPHALLQPYLATGAVFRFPFRKGVTTTPNGVKFQPAKLKDLGEMFLAAMALPIVLFLNHTRTITLIEVSESGVEKLLSFLKDM